MQTMFCASIESVFGGRCAFGGGSPLLVREGRISIVGSGTSKDLLAVANAYAESGVSAVTGHQGRFAFALYDHDKRRLLAARDRIGESTLYFAEIDGGVTVASDVDSLLPMLPTIDIDPQVLAWHLRYNFPLDVRRTWIRQVNRVRPGEYVCVDEKGLKLNDYWRRNHAPRFTGTRQDAMDETLRRLRNSVTKLFMSDGPVAVMLSGGLDSTSLAVLAKECGKEVHVISAGYRDCITSQVDERGVARRFAREKGLTYHEIELSSADFSELFDEFSGILDEPFCDLASMAQFAVYRQAAQMGFRGILSGLGGDEQFFSYHDLLRGIPLSRPSLLKRLANGLKSLVGVDKGVEISFMPWLAGGYRAFVEDALLETSHGILSFGNQDISCRFPRDTDMLSMYDFIFRNFMVHQCVYIGSRLCEANGISLRCPFLDVDLVEFLDSIPLEMKYAPSHPKQFQRDLMRNLLPDYVLHAPKRPFGPPPEFVTALVAEKNYHHFQAAHKTFNSLLVDRVLSAREVAWAYSGI